jgi:hypothetical protein
MAAGAAAMPGLCEGLARASRLAADTLPQVAGILTNFFYVSKAS